MNEKTVFVFRCRTHSEILGYTLDHSGSNLPTPDICIRGWEFLSSVEISDNPFSLIGENAVKILKAIEETGFFISSNKKEGQDPNES
jgi:hypothetical protein